MIFSTSYGILELGDLLAGLNDCLLDQRLVALELLDLFLHVLIFISLSVDLVCQVVEVRHDERIDDLHVLVIQRGQMVLH